jgi:hypothetical protein
VSGVSLPFSSHYWALKRERSKVWSDVERLRQDFVTALRNAQRHEEAWAWVHEHRGTDVERLESHHAAVMARMFGLDQDPARAAVAEHAAGRAPGGEATS